MDTSHAELIKRCRKDLQNERIVKSVLCGAAIGFSVCFIVALITWIVEAQGLWLTLGLGIPVGIVAGLLFYFCVFTVTDMTVMQRLDRAGLDERMVTMYELQGDDSYMAQRQRADAVAAFGAAVKATGGQLIQMKIATAVVCAVSIACPLGIGMTTITALSDYGVIAHGSSVFEGVFNPPTPTQYTVTFQVGESGGGTIVGELKQTVVKGGTTSAVKAEETLYVQSNPLEQYHFLYWEDQLGNRYSGRSRVVENVQKSMTFTAVFGRADGVGDIDLAYYFDPDRKKDDPDDDGEERDGDEERDERGEHEKNPGGNGADKGATDPDNAIVDGETSYGENLDGWRGDAMGELSGSEGIPGELVEATEGFFGIL